MPATSARFAGDSRRGLVPRRRGGETRHGFGARGSRLRVPPVKTSRCHALLVASIVLAIFACRSGETWTGFIHETRGNPDPKKGHNMGEFHSLQACRAACTSLIRERRCPGDECWADPDYECGVGCLPNGYGLNTCQRTER